MPVNQRNEETDKQKDKKSITNRKIQSKTVHSSIDKRKNVQPFFIFVLLQSTKKTYIHIDKKHANRQKNRKTFLYGQLSRLSTAKESYVSLVTVGPDKVKACKSIFSLKVPLKSK